MYKKLSKSFLGAMTIVLFIFVALNNSSVRAEELSAPATWSLSFDSPLYQMSALEVYNGYLYAAGFDLSQTNGA